MDATATQSNLDATHARDVGTLEMPGAIWRVDPLGRDMISCDSAPDFFALEQEPGAVRVKDGAGRATWRVTLGTRNVFCKVYERPRGLDRIKRLLLGPIARHEFENSQAPAARGVALARAVAWGRQTSAPHRTVVVSSEIEPATVLTDCALTPSTASDVIDAVARLLADAHNAGILHGDGHPGNILIQHELTAACTAWFVDLQAVRFYLYGVSSRRAAHALGQLDHYYTRVATQRQRLRFLVSYLANRPGTLRNRSATRAFVDRVRRASEAQAVRLAWHRDRRLKYNNKYFTTLELGNDWQARVALKLARRRIAPAPHVVDRSEGQWRTILNAWLTERTPTDAAAPRRDQPGRGILCFATRHTGFVSRLLLTLFGSPARRAFEHCHRLRHRDLPTPLVLGYLERRRGGLTDLSVMIVADDSDDRDDRGRPGTSDHMAAKPAQASS